MIDAISNVKINSENSFREMFSFAGIKYCLLIDVIAPACLHVYVGNTILLAIINNSSGNYYQLMKFVITLAYGKTNYCMYVCACMREMKCILT